MKLYLNSSLLRWRRMTTAALQYLGTDDCVKLLTALVAEQNAAERAPLSSLLRGARRPGARPVYAAGGGLASIPVVSRELAFRDQFAEKAADDELLQYVALSGNRMYHYAQQRFAAAPRPVGGAGQFIPEGTA